MRKYENAGKIFAGAGLWLCLGAALVQPVPAAVTNLRVVSTTSTQIAVSFTITAPETACTIEISESPSYTPLMADVDSTLFTSANLCNRSGSVVSGNNYTVVFGRRGPDAIVTDILGYTRSRALFMDALFYIRITNGSSATIQARTPTIMLGSTLGEPLAMRAPFQYKQVTRNPLVNSTFADPYTGARIYNNRNFLGFGYSATTQINGAAISGCNIVVGSEKGACRFTDATGSNWSFTSTSLTAAIQADDDNFVEYSGTAQEKLFIRYGIDRFQFSNSYGAILASQNLIFRAKTTDASGDGGYLRTCYTEDSTTCMSPERRVELTATEATYVVCHTSPCEAKDEPGDFLVDTPVGTRPSPARLYSEAADYSIMKLVGGAAASECASIAVGEKLLSFNSETNGDNPIQMTVDTKDCGASPPQFTVTVPQNFSQNGSEGTTFWRYGGVSSLNWNFGILVWKESTTSGSTIQIDVPLWRATWSMNVRFNSGAGGFGRNCQNVPTAAGYYLCIAGNDGAIIYGVKPSPTGLDFKNYGYAAWQGNQLSANLQASGGYVPPYNSNVNYMPWDDEVPGVFYMFFTWNGGVANGKRVLVKLTMDLVEKTVADKDDASDPIFGSTRAPKVSLSNVAILTPCLNACSVTETDDFTLAYQAERFSVTWGAEKGTFPDCGIQVVQALTLIYSCSNGGQDNYNWLFAVDLGNRLPYGSGFIGTQGGNTQQLYGAFALHKTPEARWSAFHTYQSPAHPGGAKFAVLEATNKCQLQVTGTALSACTATPGGTCSACPDVTLDGYSYAGKNMCSTLTFSSAWNGAWGTAPPTFSSGDPVDAVCGEAPNLYWLQKWQVGDFANHTQSGEGVEYVRLLRDEGGGTWTVVRGWGGIRDSSTYGAKNHSNGGTWFTKGGSIIKDPVTSAPLAWQGIAWFFEQDPTGTNPAYTFLNQYQNHGVNVLNHGLEVGGGYTIGYMDFDSPSSVKAQYARYFPIGTSFAGKTSDCQGNSCEKHPAATQVAATDVLKDVFVDIHPRLMTGTTTKSDWQLVAGKSYIRVYTGNRTLNFKHYGTEVFMGFFGLMRKDTLSDSESDSGYFCDAIKNDDCFTGSVAGNLYKVNTSFDVEYTSGTRISCRHTQFSTWMGDGCASNASPASAVVGLYNFPPITAPLSINGEFYRVISKEWRTYREAATENAKMLPSGEAILMRGTYYIMVPSIPQRDTINRAEFIPFKLNLDAVPPGTSTVLVQFGHNTSFQCSPNRDESCYIESASINRDNPFLFSHETLTGLSCNAGCAPTIPLISNRLTYYRVLFRDGSGNVIHRTETKVASRI